MNNDSSSTNAGRKTSIEHNRLKNQVMRYHNQGDNIKMIADKTGSMRSTVTNLLSEIEADSVKPSNNSTMEIIILEEASTRKRLEKELNKENSNYQLVERLSERQLSLLKMMQDNSTSDVEPPPSFRGNSTRTMEEINDIADKINSGEISETNTLRD